MIYMGGDHAGFKLKEKLKTYFRKQGMAYDDLGPQEFVPTDDYPDYGVRVAKAVAQDSKHRGILICGSSAGVCIVANKIKRIRAIQAYTAKGAKLAREHNDANILCLSGWELSGTRAKSIANTFLKTPFTDQGRHKRRVSKIQRIEDKTMK